MFRLQTRRDFSSERGGNGPELFRLELRRDFSPKTAAGHWDGFLREVVEPPSLGVLKERSDVVLGDTARWVTLVGGGDLECFFQPL